MAALDASYEVYERINGGPNCGICGAPPKPGRRNHRDHDHHGTGTARGLLCFQHNRMLGPQYTLEFLYAAVRYLERTAS